MFDVGKRSKLINVHTYTCILTKDCYKRLNYSCNIMKDYTHLERKVKSILIYFINYYFFIIYIVIYYIILYKISILCVCLNP